MCLITEIIHVNIYSKEVEWHLLICSNALSYHLSLYQSSKSSLRKNTCLSDIFTNIIRINIYSHSLTYITIFIRVPYYVVAFEQLFIHRMSRYTLHFMQLKEKIAILFFLVKHNADLKVVRAGLRRFRK